MPPTLSIVLAALEVSASRGEFRAFEALLGGSFAGLDAVRESATAKTDATGPASQQATDWLAGLPIRPGSEVHVAWAADRAGARMSYATLTASISDLW